MLSTPARSITASSADALATSSRCSARNQPRNCSPTKSCSSRATRRAARSVRSPVSFGRARARPVRGRPRTSSAEPDRRNHWTGTAVEQVLHDHHRVIALLDGLPVEAPRELADRLMVVVIGKTKLSDQKLRDLIKHSNKHRLLDEDFEFPDIRSGPRVSDRRVRRLGGQERRRVLHAARRRSPDGRADQAARGDACLRPCVGSGGMLIHGRH